MKKYEYIITMNNGSRYNVVGYNKRMVAHELTLLCLPVVAIERVYKSGKRAACPW